MQPLVSVRNISLSTVVNAEIMKFVKFVNWWTKVMHKLPKCCFFVFCLGDYVWAYLEKKLFSQETK